MATTRLFQGDKGYLYIPYDYMTDPNMTRDLFVIKQFSKIELGTDHWKESASELNFPEPSAFGASADGSNDADAWGFEGDDGEDQISSGFSPSADVSGANE